MNKLSFFIAGCLIAWAMTGCTLLESQPGSPGHQGSRGQMSVFTRDRYTSDQLLLYAKRYGELSAENQKLEYTQVMQSLGHNAKDILSRLKAAIIFSMPSSPYRDANHAQILLKALQREKLDDDITTFVAVLKTYVDDRQQLEDNDARLIQKSRSEQRRADELQQKLDDLKNIEKNMIERDRAPKK